jgi:hypothetical protein
VGGSPLGAAGTLPIARVLAESRSLAFLGLASASLGPSLDVAKRLANALKQNTDLLSLDLRHNELTPEGERLLRAAAAQRSRSQERLELLLEPQAPLAPGSLVSRTPRDPDAGLGALTATTLRKQTSTGPAAAPTPRRPSRGLGSGLRKNSKSRTGL